MKKDHRKCRILLGRSMPAAIFSIGIFSTSPAQAAFLVNGFDFGSEDAAISGFQVESFEDTDLIPGLTISLSGGPGMNATYSGILPGTLLAGSDPNGFSSNNQWDGAGVLSNQAGNVFIGSGPVQSKDTVFSFATPQKGFGIGLSNFQSLRGCLIKAEVGKKSSLC